MSVDGEDDFDDGPISKEPEVSLTRDVLKRSVILILASLVAGVFLVWIVRFEFVLWAVSFVLEFAILALGFFAGEWVYKSIHKPTPNGVRIAVAIIIGFAVTVMALELTRSHKLIRISEEMWSSADDE
jgi:hypothetical protein